MLRSTVRGRAAGTILVAVGLMSAMLSTVPSSSAASAATDVPTTTKQRVAAHHHKLPARQKGSGRLSAKVRLAGRQWTPTSVTVPTIGKHLRTTYFGQPQFHRTAQGWQPLSGALHRSAGQFGWRAPNTVLPTDFAVAGSTVMRLHLPLATIPITLRGAHLSRPQVRQHHGSHLLAYREVFRGVDAEYRVQGPEIKENLVLKSPGLASRSPSIFTTHGICSASHTTTQTGRRRSPRLSPTTSRCRSARQWPTRHMAPIRQAVRRCCPLRRRTSPWPAPSQGMWCDCAWTRPG